MSVRLSHPKEPILTLPVPGSRIYVVTEPSLAASVQRSTKTLSMSPLLPEITKRVLGLDETTCRVIGQNLDPEPGEPRGFLADIHEWVYTSLGPGEYVNALSCEAAQELCLQLHAVISSLHGASDVFAPVDLLTWVRHMVTVGTARYLFGPHNPIAEDPDLEHAFWAFDHGLGGLLINILPSLTASKAYGGRERLSIAFRKYLEAGHLDSAASIVRGRARIEKEYGMSVDMTARSALSFLFAGIVNTTTTTFWVILRIFADENLLAKARHEIRQALELSSQRTGSDSLSIGVVKETCTTLSAVYRESLRVGSENFSVRMIKEDTMLADRYFLKKGAVVQISGGAIHANSTIWGQDVDKFNPDRFLKEKGKGDGFHPAAFRGFGGGKTLCPGRDFATNEILMFVAMIVHGVDLLAPGGGSITVPEKNDRVLPVHILEPKGRDRPKVIIKPRAEEAEVLSRLKVAI
ncbi:cytochrome p450 [Trichoderma arundinaceum]|uniref:Cytochrome p450 n=1 Tax=Trichoderma arundinaceum TaxID=490622 RepID=A0A395P001_TRIAR|nr:cytochrome p450 [Trichoderma arundinaceum]